MEILFEGEKMEIWRECKLFLQEERWRFWEEWVSFCNWQEEGVCGDCFEDFLFDRFAGLSVL